MSTIVKLPQQEGATLPRNSYLNDGYGLKSWLLTGDHKRIAMLYLASITFFFFLGGAMAGLIRLELLTPLPDLVASDTYNKLFTMHGVIMVFLFLVPSVPAVIGNFVLPIMVGAKDLAFPKINLLSWYLYMIAGIFTISAMVLGGVDTGWTFTTPLSTHYLNTHVITAALGIFIAGFSSIFTGSEFHRDHPSHARSRHDVVPPAPVCVVALRGFHPDGSGNSGAGHRNCSCCTGANDRHWRLRSGQGRRPAALPTSVLVLFASCGLHHDPARHGRDLRGHQHLLAQARLRLHGSRLLLGCHRGLRILCLGSPHVHHGCVELLGAGLLASHDAGCGAFGHQDLQLVSDSV